MKLRERQKWPERKGSVRKNSPRRRSKEKVPWRVGGTYFQVIYGGAIHGTGNSLEQSWAFARWSIARTVPDNGNEYPSASITFL